jgi:hypothetical protein
MIQNRLERFPVPKKRLVVEGTERIVASIRERWILLSPPPIVVVLDRAA